MFLKNKREPCWSCEKGQDENDLKTRTMILPSTYFVFILPSGRGAETEMKQTFICRACGVWGLSTGQGYSYPWRIVMIPETARSIADSKGDFNFQSGIYPGDLYLEVDNIPRLGFYCSVSQIKNDNLASPSLSYWFGVSWLGHGNKIGMRRF